MMFDKKKLDALVGAERETVEVAVLPAGLEVSRMSFSVDLSMAQMRRLMAAEFDDVVNAIVGVAADDATIDEVNYDGHFGAAFYFRVSDTSVNKMLSAGKLVRERLIKFLGEV